MRTIVERPAAPATSHHGYHHQRERHRRHHQHRNRRPPTTIVRSSMCIWCVCTTRRRSFAYNSVHHDSGCNFLQSARTHVLRCANKSARPCLQSRDRDYIYTPREKSLLNASLFRNMFSIFFRYICKVYKFYASSVLYIMRPMRLFLFGERDNQKVESERSI